MKYADLLKDPRWQKRRLEVFDLAGWACAVCGATTRTLHVHHLRYVRGRKPWEYSHDDLLCLCDACHAAQHPEATGATSGLAPLVSIVPDALRSMGVDFEVCVVCRASFRVPGEDKCTDCRYDPFDRIQHLAEFPDEHAA